MNLYYNQLAGALGVLKSNGIPLNYEAINQQLKQIAKNGPDCDTTEIRTLYRHYRQLCLSYKLIQPGELFSLDDCIPLV